MSATERGSGTMAAEKLNKDIDERLGFYLRESFAELNAIAGRQYIAKAVARETEEDSELKELLKTTAETFSERLLFWVKVKAVVVADLCKKSGIERRHFSKMKNKKDYRPSKNTVLALAIGLELELEEAEDLLKHAGYALTKSSKTDLVVEYCLCNGIYDMDTVNMLLFKYTGSLLLE